MDARPIGQIQVMVGQNMVNVGQFLIDFCPKSDYDVSVAGQIKGKK
jgi:hypothetical protein